MDSEVTFYNECILKIQCFSKEVMRLEKVTDKDIQDVYENLNIPNLDMSIEEIYDYTTEKLFDKYKMYKRQDIVSSLLKYALDNIE